MDDARAMGLEVHLTCSRACMLIVGAAFKESMVGKQYDQADGQEKASVRPFAEYALSSGADSTRRGVFVQIYLGAASTWIRFLDQQQKTYQECGKSRE